MYNTSMKQVSKEYFVELADRILDQHGIETAGYFTYEDDVVLIRDDFAQNYFEIVRKENDNPVTMADSRRNKATRKIFRHHGEHGFITEHMEGLV